MIGKRIIFIFAIIISSCVHEPEKETIQKFILYGHSGFCFIDSSKWVFDSTKFDVRQYFEYTKGNLLNIAKRGYLEKTKYYRVNPIDTIGLYSLIENIKNVVEKDSDYYPEPNTSMYDGYYYTIYFLTSTNRAVKINYIPSCLPIELRSFHDTVIQIIASDRNQLTSSFILNTTLKGDALKAYKRYPIPPAPCPVEKVKFTRPITTYDTL
jgi:hypothetical protein